MSQSTSILPPHSLPENLLPDGKKIAYVQAGWHREIVEQSQFAFTDHLLDQGVSRDQIAVFDVPGSLEIPLQCKLLANSGDFALIVAAGLIVDGGIYRHDFVASTVLDSMMSVQLETTVPILSVVLTPHHYSGDQAHHDFFFEHFKYKGEEAGRACLQTLENIYRMKQAV
ncbi:MAG: 6,7-dimethyl-8-ribityllumazine synthase [Gammaproteobacteria bacterium]|nr:6,7-dimethyl-8-ribityllumazine synthase [Gammaproteobacteria bacterium]